LPVCFEKSGEGVSDSSVANDSETLSKPEKPVDKAHFDEVPAWKAMLSPGQGIDELGRLGPYRVLQILGKGGMGMVFRAEDALLKRPVALKVMLPAIAANSSARQRFIREAQLAAAVRHQHVVTIHQVGEDNGVPFLAMEFLEGEPLDVCLRKLGRLPVAEAVRIAWQTAEGLAAAHALGLIHRDIKPANIWLERKESKRRTEAKPAGSSGLRLRPAVSQVKILDFGLARAARDSENLTLSGTVLGTPAYMAPEQAKSGEVDGRADLFSLGCVLYHMLTGNKPFFGEDLYAVLLSVAMHEPAPPHEIDPFVPRPLSDLVMRLLAKSPDERPSSANEVAELLELINEDRTAELGLPNSPPLALPIQKPGGNSPREVTRTAKEHSQALARRGYAFLRAEHRRIATPRRGEASWLKPIRHAVVPATLLVFLTLVGSSFAKLLSRPNIPTPSVVAANATPGLPPVKSTPTKITNSIGMQLVLIPKGSFRMGSPRSEPDRFDNEEQHEVDVEDPFYLGSFEVTQAQFEKVMKANPSFFSPAGAGREKVKDQDAGRLPVENVSWRQAVDFCDKLSALPEEKSKSRVYRLPAEAEWEYACRGGYNGAHATHFGGQLSSFQANFNGLHAAPGAVRGPFLARPTIVGQYPANDFGLFDMHGNVAEWCADWHDGICVTEPGRVALQVEPANPKGVRAVRGGSWVAAARGCRTACRTFAEPDERSAYWGFRVAMTAPPD